MKTNIIIATIIIVTTLIYGYLVHLHDIRMDMVSDEWVAQMEEDYEMFPEDWE